MPLDCADLGMRAGVEQIVLQYEHAADALPTTVVDIDERACSRRFRESQPHSLVAEAEASDPVLNAIAPSTTRTIHKVNVLGMRSSLVNCGRPPGMALPGLGRMSGGSA